MLEIRQFCSRLFAKSNDLTRIDFKGQVINNFFGRHPRILQTEVIGLLVLESEPNALVNAIYRISTDPVLVKCLCVNGRSYSTEHSDAVKNITKNEDLILAVISASNLAVNP